MESARPAAPNDAPRLAELAAGLRDELRAMRGGDLWVRREAEPAVEAAAWAARVSAPDCGVVVGAIDDVVVGYGLVEIETLRDGTRHAVIAELFVEPEARAIGVGEAVLDALVALARAAGVEGIDSVALPGHRAAKNFFEGAGFTARAIVMHRDA